MKRLLPLFLSLLTFALLAALLWPQEEPTTTMVVAARDLGAGAVLVPADLNTLTVPLEQAPSDAIGDPSLLVGQSLAVVRYAGEPLTPRHLGPAVILAPDERGIAVRVEADTGLAGLLRPGMAVGLIATLPAAAPENSTSFGLSQASIYAKSTLHGLRVLYVPPSFQARSPQTETSLTAPDGSYVPPTSSEPVERGVIVLAAGTLPEPILFEEAETLVRRNISGEGAGESEGTGGTEEDEPTVVWAVPVELLAALNASDAVFTLVLEPKGAAGYGSPGVDMTSIKNEE